MKTKFYSDRVTTIYTAKPDQTRFEAAEIVVYGVTLEPIARESEPVDFCILAWCLDQESADFIARALNTANTLTMV